MVFQTKVSGKLFGKRNSRVKISNFSFGPFPLGGISWNFFKPFLVKEITKPTLPGRANPLVRKPRISGGHLVEKPRFWEKKGPDYYSRNTGIPRFWRQRPLFGNLAPDWPFGFGGHLRNPGVWKKNFPDFTRERGPRFQRLYFWGD